MAEAFVVDASVVAKWFNRGEQFENEAAVLRSAWVRDELELLAPSHLPYEVANSVWKNPNVGSREAGTLVKLLVKLSPKLVDLSEDLASETMDVARKKRMTFYDASYLAVAKHFSHPLVTADKDRLRLAKKYVTALHLSSFGQR
jgi:predicted nucleic acid-binding protein